MKLKLNLNRKKAGILSGILILAVIGCNVSYRAIEANAQVSETDESEPKLQTENKNRFSEEGTTQIKTQTQLPDFSVGAVTMTVEEVYVASGSAVEEGTALYKLTDESIADAIAYYEDAVNDAQNTLEAAQLNLANGVLDAENELQAAQLSADTAQSTYDAKLAELTLKVQEKKQEYDDAVEQITEYQNALNDGTYYNQVGATEKQAAVDTAASTLADAQTALSASQSDYDAAQAAMAADIDTLKSRIAENASYETLQTLTELLATDYADVQAATLDLSQKQINADTAQSTLEQANTALENAGKEYDMLVQNANNEIENLFLQLEDLQEAYEQAERDAVTAQADIQNDYEEAVLSGKYAGTEYETTLAELVAAVEIAQETLDDLMEEQESLLALEDGVICADREGIVAVVTYEKEDVLISKVALVTYYDTDTIYISVEVAQEQIAMLTVGDAVDVLITGSRGSVSGEIASIATEKTSGGSISNVTYTVVIAIDNADGSLKSGSSATVMFDYEDME